MYPKQCDEYRAYVTMMAGHSIKYHAGMTDI